MKHNNMHDKGDKSPIDWSTRPMHNINITKIHQKICKYRLVFRKEADAFCPNRIMRFLSCFVMLMIMVFQMLSNQWQKQSTLRFFDSFNASQMVSGTVWYWFQKMTHGLSFGFESFPLAPGKMSLQWLHASWRQHYQRGSVWNAISIHLALRWSQKAQKNAKRQSKFKHQTATEWIVSCEFSSKILHFLNSKIRSFSSNLSQKNRISPIEHQQTSFANKHYFFTCLFKRFFLCIFCPKIRFGHRSLFPPKNSTQKVP